IGNLPREGIAEQIEILNKYEPRVIGVDAFFRQPKSPVGDSILASAFSKVKNLVLVSKTNRPNPETGQFDTLELSHPMFSRYALSGMSNLISEGYDKFKTSRDFSPKERVYDTVEYAFSVVLANFKDPEAVSRLLARNNETETINFQGNVDTYSNETSYDSKNVFYALDVHQVLNEEFEPSIIKDKIVLMGYMGANFNHVTWEDKFFTPLNPNYIGKTNPDMYGVVVHANIVAMILNGNFIDELPEWLNLVIGLIVTFLNFWLFSYLYFKLRIWYDGVTMILTLTQTMVVLGLVVYIFNAFSYKIDITLPIVALFLTANTVEIYFGIMHPGFRKIRQKILMSKTKIKVNYEN
ncbi:MAG TPA: CHASE2 domain-containing protein, partial [Cytophagaceae bacterium]